MAYGVREQNKLFLTHCNWNGIVHVTCDYLVQYVFTTFIPKISNQFSCSFILKATTSRNSIFFRFPCFKLINENQCKMSKEDNIRKGVTDRYRQIKTEWKRDRKCLFFT